MDYNADDYVAPPCWENVQRDMVFDTGLINEISGAPIRFGIQYASKRIFLGTDCWVEVRTQITSDNPGGYLIVRPRTQTLRWRRGQTITEPPICFVRSSGERCRTVYRRAGTYIFEVNAADREAFFQVASITYSENQREITLWPQADFTTFSDAYFAEFDELWQPIKPPLSEEGGDR
jgi:hypothetical protein